MVHPILFAAYAVLYLYADNVRFSLLGDALPSLVLAVVGGTLALAMSSVLLRDLGGGALTAAVIVGIFFFLYPPVGAIFHVIAVAAAPEFEEAIKGPAAGSAFVIVGVVAIGGTLFLSRRARRHLPAINTGLSVASTVLVGIPLLGIAVGTSSGAPLYVGGPSQIIAARTTARDIYYLVFDRYGTNGSLEGAFGVTANDLPAWLEQRGFFVASRAHANYDRTTLSVPATLSLDYLDGLITRLGPTSTNYTPLFDMIQDHRVGRFLQEQGYEYVYLGNWFSPTSRVAIADRSTKSGDLSEFEAVLYGQTAIPALAGVMTLRAPVPATDQIQVDSARFQFAALASLADDPGRRFVHAHVLLPHDPFVFDADGEYVPVAARRNLSTQELFEHQLTYTNAMIKELVERLLARPESEQPVIIIQADEGPYPQRYATSQSGFDWTAATKEEIRTKFGILDSFYLPPEGNQPSSIPEPYPTISSVNTFRLVFDRYFGTDLPLLPDHAYAARHSSEPFDMIEVTDRLAAP